MYAGSSQMVALWVYSIALTLILLITIIGLWPYATGTERPTNSDTIMGFIPYHPESREQLIILIVLLGGALGSLVHVMRSLVVYIGKRELIMSWQLFYYLKPVIGAMLALVFYLALRGGILMLVTTVKDDPENLNVAGITAIALLTGMFTDAAVDKLHEIFTSLFRSTKDPADHHDHVADDSRDDEALGLDDD